MLLNDNDDFFQYISGWYGDLVTCVEKCLTVMDPRSSFLSWTFFREGRFIHIIINRIKEIQNPGEKIGISFVLVARWQDNCKPRTPWTPIIVLYILQHLCFYTQNFMLQITGTFWDTNTECKRYVFLSYFLLEAKNRSFQPESWYPANIKALSSFFIIPKWFTLTALFSQRVCSKSSRTLMNYSTF